MLQFQEERLWAAAAGLIAHGAHDRRRRSSTAASARPSASRCSTTRWCTSAWPSCKTEVELLRALVYRAVEEYARRRGRHHAGVDGQAQGRPPVARGHATRCLQYWGGMGFTWDNPRSRAPIATRAWLDRRRRRRDHARHHLQADGHPAQQAEQVAWIFPSPRSSRPCGHGFAMTRGWVGAAADTTPEQGAAPHPNPLPILRKEWGEGDHPFIAHPAVMKR